ncbi:fructosamine kinase family protein [Gillisia sp. Q332]|uniref:fructosamine kinase family protein n=1 Tax=Gillisia xinjiangensis TaxID=3384765 RepID=UPI00391AF3D4
MLLLILPMNANEDFKAIFDQLAEKNNFQIANFTRLSGGSINDVFLITSLSSEKFVIKLNSSHKFPGMFDAEKAGLEILKKAKNIDVPKAFDVGEFKSKAYLLLEYKAPANPTENFWELFGKHLAGLHKNTALKFGLANDNYIGSLSQQNNFCTTSAEFYISQRLEPQLKLAKDKNYDLGISGNFFRNISEIIPQEPPSLIHGDLWNGNYLVNSSGHPCLIDPAIAYAPREMDLAMMQLFGGFDQQVFESYQSEFPLSNGFEERIPIWQLYYLLVHLNLFGSGYKSAVMDMIKRFS